MSLMSRIAKKIRRRFRKKGTSFLNPSSRMTQAEKLIANNWNISFKFPVAEQKGQKRSLEIMAAKRKANAKIPVIDRIPTRQVFRQMARRKMKEHSLLVNAGCTRKHG